MNNFEKLLIDHLSASSINRFMADQSGWCVNYLLNQKFKVGYAAFVGKAVETGLAQKLFFPETSLNECTAMAVRQFDAEVKSQGGLMTDDLSEHYEKIKSMIPVAIEHFKPYGEPTRQMGNHQHKIKMDFRFGKKPNDKIETIGYLDFYYEDKPLIIDLKTTMRAPSKWSQGHGIQAAIYSFAMNCPVKFVYVTPKKIVELTLEEEDKKEFLGIAKAAVIRMNHFLSLSDDPIKLARSAGHDPSSFYWKDNPTFEQILTKVEKVEKEKSHAA
jgi:hypothetical protein